MFLKVEQGLSGPSPSVLMRQPGGRVIHVRMPIVIQKKRGMRGLGVTCPSGLVQTANGGCVDPNSIQGQKAGVSATPKAVNYASAPGCNVVDLSKNECMMDDGTIAGCNLIQECGPLTGQARCQYGPFPGQVADPSLPFCTGSGPTISYTPNKSLVNPTAPSTPFTPTAVFAANSGVALPATSTARVASPASPSPASSPTTSSGATVPAGTVAPSSQTNFLTQLLSGSNPPAGAIPSGSSTTTVIQSGGGFLSDSATIFGMQIPYWLIGLVVVGGGFLLMSGGKK